MDHLFSCVPGDNMLTALSVARDCQMIDREDKVILVHAVAPNSKEKPSIEWTYAEDHRQILEVVRQGRLGRQAISLDSEQRAYAFAFGVRQSNRLIGAIAVYVDFDPVEATWSLSTNPIFVTDQNGTVFLTNRPQWRLKPLSDLMAGT